MAEKKTQTTRQAKRSRVHKPVMKLKTYTSEQLNKRLAEIADEPEKYGFEAFGGKAIPYIGWYWRTVNFDKVDGYYFGVLPIYKSDWEENNKKQIGFMENNKWDYDEIHANADQWKKIKKLLVAVANKPCEQTLSNVYVAIQALAL